METAAVQQPIYRHQYSPEGRITSYYTPEGVFHECPEGYMTGEEFVKSAKERITNYYKKHGLL